MLPKFQSDHLSLSQVHSSYDIEVLQLKRTALNYLKTWFLLDVLASIPFSLIRQLSGGSVSSGAAFNKALRLAKLLKLLRLLRFKRLIPKLDVYPIFSHPALRLPPLIVCLLYYIHVGACFLHLVLSDQAAELGLVTFPDLYGWSIGWTIALTFGNAYPYQDADFVKITGEFSHGTISVLMLLGVFVQGIILTRVVIIALDLRQQTQHRNEQRLRLKVLLSVKRVPPELRLQCIRHFDHYWLAEGDSEEWAHVLEGLSSQLRKQLLMHTHKSLLGSSLFIEIAKTAGGRKAMLINMLEKMCALLRSPALSRPSSAFSITFSHLLVPCRCCRRTLVSTPPDIVLHPNTAPAGLFVIDEGECAVFDRGTRCFELGRGDFFGEELLTGELAKFKVQAVTPCTLHVLLEPQFQEFLTRFPDLRSQVRPLPRSPPIYDLRSPSTLSSDLRQQITRSQQKARALRRVKPPSIGDASTSHTLIRSYTKAISSTMDLAGGGRLGTRAIREKEIQGFVDLPAMYDESQECARIRIRIRPPSTRWCAFPLSPPLVRHVSGTTSSSYALSGSLSSTARTGASSAARTCRPRHSTVDGSRYAPSLRSVTHGSYLASRDIGQLPMARISHLEIQVSYPWLGKEHPDNDGWHLGILGRLLELFCDLYGDAAVFIVREPRPRRISPPPHRRPCAGTTLTGAHMLVAQDFCSLYQHPPHGGERSAKEDTLFKMSLQGLKHLYAHQATWVFCLKSIPPGSQVPAYDSRGWPTFETAISSWIKGSRKLLDISLLAPPEGLISFLDGCESWHDDVHARCVARRDQPLSPAKFSALLGTKTFTNGNDCEVVAGLYADVFVEVFSQVRHASPPPPTPTHTPLSRSSPTLCGVSIVLAPQVQELDFSGLTWTHLDNLIDTLKDASAKTVGMTCPNLKFLWFFDHVIDEPKAVRTRLQEAVGDGCEVFGLDD